MQSKSIHQNGYRRRNVFKSVFYVILNYFLQNCSNKKYDIYEEAQKKSASDFVLRLGQTTQKKFSRDNGEKIFKVSTYAFKAKLAQLHEEAQRNLYLAEICHDALLQSLELMYRGVFEKRIKNKNHEAYLSLYNIYFKEFHHLLVSKGLIDNCN